MNAGSQVSSVEIAVNSARVTPTAKGCYGKQNMQLGHAVRLKGHLKWNSTYAGDTQAVLITDMDISDRDLDIVDDFAN